MCTGRCAGCGYVAHAGKVRDHQMNCPEFAGLFRQRGPGGLLPVEDEYWRWKAEEMKAERRAAHAVTVADTDRRREAMAARFATKDILED